MNVIKIVLTPLGQAPEWVREKWVGVKISVPDQLGGRIQMSAGGVNLGNLQIETNKAIEALEKKSPKAVAWWKNNFPLDTISHFVFPKDVCEIVDQRFIPPSSMVTEEMVRLAQTDDLWHFARNLNALMQYGYCPKCGLVPEGCEREGCGMGNS